MPLARPCLRLALAVAIAAFAAACGPAWSSELRASLGPVSSERVIYNWYADRCAPTDTVDAPARVFRDFRGALHLIAAHEENRFFVGPDFDHLRYDCRIVYRGGHDFVPSHFDDEQWLTAFSTDDGVRIFALVHNEFHGDLRPALCPSRRYLSCWWNSLTMATSSDGGYAFREPAPPGNLIASVPSVYQGDFGRPVGYFQPTNIVRRGGYSYVIFRAEAFGDQPRGKCVARTSNVADPGAWRGWDGHDFDLAFANPYAAAQARSTGRTCATVGGGALFETGSLEWDESTKLFAALTWIRDANGSSTRPAGAYLATSPDLLTWSRPQLVASETDLSKPEEEGGYHFGFFSLIDERSASLDFKDHLDKPISVSILRKV